MDAELNSLSNEYLKNKKYMKKCDDDIIIMFFTYFFLGRGAQKKYVKWELVECII